MPLKIGPKPETHYSKEEAAAKIGQELVFVRDFMSPGFLMGVEEEFHPNLRVDCRRPARVISTQETERGSNKFRLLVLVEKETMFRATTASEIHVFMSKVEYENFTRETGRPPKPMTSEEPQPRRKYCYPARWAARRRQTHGTEAEEVE